MKRLGMAALVALMVSVPAFAQETTTPAPAAKPAPAAAKPAPAAKKADAVKYDKCVVTGEELGSMGKPTMVAYTGKDAAYKGKSVPVCCGGCVGKVQKDPDLFFKKVYGVAKAAPAKTAKPAPKKS